ncbi:MAG: DUF3179 domain-containing protein [Meiothermus sp.]|nr:DUF3179 domain-containing protein [Meiothermus sp.]
MKKLVVILSLLCTVSSLAESNFPYLGTDVSKARIALEQIISAGPPPQGVPALGFTGDRNGRITATAAPKFVALADARLLSPEEPVVVVGSKAYPLRILRWHEVVNDGTLIVTYSPLCNSAAVYDRRVALSDAEREAVLRLDPRASVAALDPAFKAAYSAQTGQPAPNWGLEVSFGTSGMLYRANPLIFDSATGSVFAQMTGEGAVGALSNTRLLRIPSQVVSFAAFSRAFPGGQVLSTETGFTRAYAQNPYFGYDRPDEPPLLYLGNIDTRLQPKERVVALEVGQQSVAYPFSLIAQRQAVNDQLGGLEVAVWWAAGTRSALDANSFEQARDVGAVGVFSRRLEGRTLSFRFEAGSWVDQETNSRWNILGQATDGALRGKRLETLAHDTPLWFAQAAFRPNTQIRR